MSKNTFIVALAVGGLLIGPGAVLAQNPPLAGSAVAGSAAISGVPIGPGSAGGANNSVNDPSGIGNAARLPAPNAGTVAPVYPSAPQSAGVTGPRSTIVPTRRSAGRRFSRNTSPQEAEIRLKENERLLNSKLQSICRGC
jgi:hypothetical protein